MSRHTVGDEGVNGSGLVGVNGVPQRVDFFGESEAMWTLSIACMRSCLIVHMVCNRSVWRIVGAKRLIVFVRLASIHPSARDVCAMPSCAALCIQMRPFATFIPHPRTIWASLALLSTLSGIYSEILMLLTETQFKNIHLQLRPKERVRERQAFGNSACGWFGGLW